VVVTNGYTTVAELRAHFGDTGTTLPVADLERAINATSRAIDKHTGRRFWQDTDAQAKVFRPESCDAAWVDDISTTTGLIVATDDSNAGSYSVTWSASDYELEPLNADTDATAHAWWRLAAVGSRRFPTYNRRASLQVTARFGWSAIPDGVAQACLIRAAAIFKRREAVFGVAGFNGFGEVRITRKDPDVIDLLYPFVKVGFGG
jgi:hypothetical protein